MHFEIQFTAFDKIIFIQADDDIRRTRLTNRKTILSKLADEVIKSQIPEEEKIPKCDYVINNNDTLEDFKRTVKDFINLL